MTIDENIVKDIRFLLKQIIDCPSKRRILEAMRKGTSEE